MATDQIKIITVGDSGVGKTTLLKAFITQEATDAQKHTIFDIYDCELNVDNSKYSLSLYDLGGHDSYYFLRPINYPQTSCFLIFYSVSDSDSFKNISRKWWPEIKPFIYDAPVFLVCTKCDLRESLDCGNCINRIEGLTLQKEINAKSLIECSAFENVEDLSMIFENAVRAVNLTHKIGYVRRPSLIELFKKLITREHK